MKADIVGKLDKIKPTIQVALNNINIKNIPSNTTLKLPKTNVDIIAEKYPAIYQNMCEALNKTEFEGEIKAIAIPMDVPVPDWLKDFIDYTSFVTDNIAGFPYESLGVQRMDRSITRSNIVKL